MKQHNTKHKKEQEEGTTRKHHQKKKKGNTSPERTRSKREILHQKEQKGNPTKLKFQMLLLKLLLDTQNNNHFVRRYLYCDRR